MESTVFNAEDLPFETFRSDGSLKRRVTYTPSGQMASMENGTGQVVQFSYDQRHDRPGHTAKLVVGTGRKR